VQNGKDSWCLGEEDVKIMDGGTFDYNVTIKELC
jgi:hypothetical protein